MLNSKERKLERLHNCVGDEMSANVYNLCIGGLLLYGFLMNAIIIATCSGFFMEMNYIVFLIGYIICCIIGVFLTNSNSPLISFIGYNFIVVPIGATLSICLPTYPVENILTAIILTGIVVTIMMIASSVYPRAFEKLGLALFLSLLIGLIVEIVALLCGYSGDIFNWFFIIVFSLYIGYDWSKAQMYSKTLNNAVDSTVDIYLDIINLFMRILRILSRKND